MARPPFKPTAAHRLRVSVAAAGGMAHEEIALALGVARNTLEKHFGLELSTVAHQRRMEVLVAQFRAAKKGNVAAQKAFLQNSPALAAPPVTKAAGEAKKVAPLGKKEQAQADAVGAATNTEWAELLRPAAPLQ
ncbi:hypothetical protein [Variovorax ginsengisoli]|uniref:Uncharacterized protein n=1 Tax=Variovorax ginsengisoli TaxID=363844 RepID=A0ABT8SE68_9BURK|nr:hypothetical protein [Variovorax ginsengisoli]MDN8617860.1 hypothetical protein [Variovorax ginsengisoli]MDO1537030.1 hypothetical protein [Variovorax ginsengisoli]